MSQTFHFFSDLLLIAGLHGIFQAGLLFSIKKAAHRYANLFLAGFVFLVALICILPIINIYLTEHYHFGHLTGLKMPIILLSLPALYLYAKFLVHPQSSLTKDNLYHLSWFVIGMLASLRYLMLDNVEKIEIFQFIMGITEGANASMREFAVEQAVLGGLYTIQILVYVVLFYRVFKAHSVEIVNYYSSLSAVKLTVVKVTISLILLSVVLYYVLNIEAAYAQGNVLENMSYHILTSVYILIIFFLGYYNFFVPELYKEQPDEKKEVIIEEKPKDNSQAYAKSGLKPEMIDEYMAKIESVMQDSKPYLKQNLTLPQFSHHVGIKQSNHVSQILNSKFNETFYEFVNRYRVEEAVALMKDPKNKHKSITEISFEAGYNSLSTFYKSFKKKYNMTPKAFMKENS